MADVCRNHLHPLEGNRGRKRSGGTFCIPCRGAARRTYRPLIDTQRDGWADPSAGAAQRRWLHDWQAGIDDAIAAIREAEGFDGTQREWTTLGECLMPDTIDRPAPLRVIEPRIVDCDRCGTPRWVGRKCASCAAGIEARRLVG